MIFLYIHHLFSESSIYNGFTVSFFPFSEQNVYAFSLFSKICVAIFVFLSGYGAARSNIHVVETSFIEHTDTIKNALKKCLSLLMDFGFVFVLLQITSFLGRDRTEVYGTGVKAVIYFVIDFFGLATLYGTPTFNPTWWYMTLAFAIIIMLPFLLDIYRTKGVLLVFLSLFLPRLLNLDFSIIFWYLPTLVLGIWCAKENILEKLKIMLIVPSYIGNKIIKFIITVSILFCLYYLRNNFGGWLELWDASIAFVITYFCFEFLSSIPIVCYVLELIGKHSANMFLTHTFIFLFYLKSFTYSFCHFLLIVIVLIVDTLLLSIFIEKIKQLIHFNELKNNIITCCFKNSTP